MRKYLILLLTLTLTSFVATKVLAQNEDKEREQSSLKTAQTFVTAYEKADWKTMRTLLTENSKAFNLGGNESLNRDKHVDFWEEIRMTLNPKIIEKKWLIGEYDESINGQWIYHWGKNRNTHNNGKTVVVPYHLSFLIIDNKINEVHFYYDRLKIIESMNFELTGPDQEY